MNGTRYKQTRRGLPCSVNTERHILTVLEWLDVWAQLHSRTAFVDHADVNEQRHLLRLWLAPDDERPLPNYYAELLGGSVEVGRRGGIRVPGYSLQVPLEAE